MVKNVIFNNFYIINPLFLIKKAVKSWGFSEKLIILANNIFEQVFNIKKQEIDVQRWYNVIVINLSCVIVVK